MRNNLVSRLLSKNISISQIVGYALANLVGLAIVLVGVQFYGDISTALNGSGEDGLKDYLVISKKVNHVSYNNKVAFTDEEIEQLRNQPWVESIGEFQVSNFNVMASVSLSSQSMSTLMFLESVPDEYIDVDLSSWKWDEEKALIPIVISKDYLALYNFGFASAMGMPQLSESVINSVPIELSFSGNGYDDNFEAYIVGYSSRLNTIVVPYDFIEWANARYAPEATERSMPSRLIVKTHTPGDPAINEYIAEQGYELGGDKVDNSKMSYFLTVLTSVVIGVGAVISILALFILLLSIYLLIEKNKEKLRDLMLLGYTPRQVSMQYCAMVVIINAIILLLAIVVAIFVSTLWRKSLIAVGMAVTGYGTMLLMAFLIIALITVVNVIVIRRRCRLIFR